MTKFTSSLEFPNGRGFTPCTPEYAAKMAEKDAIFNPTVDKGSSEKLSPDACQRYCELDNELMCMQASGKHLGISVVY